MVPPTLTSSISEGHSGSGKDLGIPSVNQATLLPPLLSLPPRGQVPEGGGIITWSGSALVPERMKALSISHPPLKAILQNYILCFMGASLPGLQKMTLF